MAHSLAAFVDRFKLDGCFKKGYFPFKYNRPEHWNVTGEPPILEYYLQPNDDSKTVLEKTNYVKSIQATPWSFSDNCYIYCEDDTRLMTAGCV